MSLNAREAAHRYVPVQRCAFGDEERGYCGERATTHLWTLNVGGQANGVTMACDEHCAWFGDRREHVRDHHPVTGCCGLPATIWRFTHPAGGPGWCDLDGFDWLAAVDHADLPAAAEASA